MIAFGDPDQKCRASAWQPAYPAQQQHAFAMANQQQGAALQSSAQSIADQYAAAYTPTYPQPQYTHQSPHVSHADALSGQNSGRTTPTLPQAQPGVPDILSQLISAGLIPAGKQGSAAAGGMKADQKAQPLIAPLVFNLSKSKVAPDSSLVHPNAALKRFQDHPILARLPQDLSCLPSCSFGILVA